MSTIALELIASMIKLGDIGPLLRGEFRKEHCTDAGSETLFEFLMSYRQITEGKGNVPAMSVVVDRFPHILLPVPAENIDLPALVYEARAYKTRMRIQALANDLTGALESADPIAELRNVRAVFDDIMKDASSTRDLSFADVAVSMLDDYSAKQLLKRGISWPWPSMNDATQGMHGGDFYIIAGRPKSRKSFLALFIAAYLVRVHKLRVLFISPEMSTHQVMLRFMAFLGEVPYAPFKAGELSESDEENLFNIVLALRDLQMGVVGDEFDSYSMPDTINAPGTEGAFVVSKATGQPVTFVEAKIKEHKPHVVIVDSFYRLGVTGKQYDSDNKVIGNVSRQLKDMAAEHEVVLVGTHQLNREAEEKIGGLANLGYSDAIGQDCDMAIRVITAKRKTGDKSALLVLGARESSIEGVLIHNEPCHNFNEIEPLQAGNRKKLLEMMTEEDNSEEIGVDRKATAAAKENAVRTGVGAPSNAKAYQGMKVQSSSTESDDPASLIAVLERKS